MEYKNERGAGHEDVPTGEIEPGKGQVARADHQRQEEIAEDVGNRGNEEKPDHDHAVKREEAVVGFRRDEIGRGRKQLQAHEHRGRSADEEEAVMESEIEQRDALVVAREQPGAERRAVEQIAGLDLLAGEEAQRWSWRVFLCWRGVCRVPQRNEVGDQFVDLLLGQAGPDTWA